ncbi:tRNA/rRNA cytosine-C5-methylase [Terriglobus roseus DSM 18391]|uniref:tRNA/rRNA cytosine-C5-methylase n=1 Tax=Terriglobus roseus (strain DSM 18391 / NRRL B-41598 / KBS 63) TaxID=926566 RepID=I3ZCX7_TERRK|nr:transcription antitermination factor NusB [Terriglobus roseus]AFL87095.1 tRNA/rRNA cytosine-C5-methylase [Terriglobus roseus DSM 18391]
MTQSPRKSAFGKPSSSGKQDFTKPVIVANPAGSMKPRSNAATNTQGSRPAAAAASKQSPVARAAVPPSEASLIRAAAAAKISPARAAAFHILSKVSNSASHSDDLLHSLAVNALSAEDRNLTTALVLGVLRWQLHLDAVMRPMLQRPDAELHPAALLALRLGVFQLLHLDRVPPHAALNESVELARANGAAHAAGMVNAILRRVLREKTTEAANRSTLAVAVTPAEQAHPAWMIARWRANFGGATVRRIAEYDQAEPPSHELFNADPALPEIDDGSRLVAELAAAAVGLPKRILDCCAAPGGKTAVLAVRHPDAEIVAADISDKRLDAMRKRMDRDPATASVKTIVADMTAPQTAHMLREGFDLILCDAPCSGTGTLARNPEIRHRLRPSDLPRQAERQRQILANALRLLAPGGILVYSTCSLEPEENEAVVAAAMQDVEGIEQSAAQPIAERIADLSPEAAEQLAASAFADAALRTLPGTQACDGFYAAVLQRKN